MEITRSSIDTTSSIAAGQTRTGLIASSDDTDWFRITMVEGQRYTVTLRGEQSGGGTLEDPHLDIWDAAGNFVVAWSSYAKECKAEQLRNARNLPRPAG